MSTARLTVVSGPSGVGKSTLIDRLRRTRDDVWVSVSVTTRAPRTGEVDGEHYFFVSPERFERMRAAGDFLESAEFAGNWYATPRAAVEQHLAQGVPVILEIDLAGARQVRQAMPSARLVFLAPPSWESLVERLRGRGTEAAEVVATRLAAAQSELAAQSEFDATVVNDSIEVAISRLVALMGLPDAARE